MNEIRSCCECMQDFIPDVIYEFPSCFVFWHECTPGVFTQNVFDKIKKKYFWQETRRVLPYNPNGIIESYHNPLLWFKKLQTDEEDNRWGT